MDPEAKKYLDLRLAKGEISEEEYTRLHRLMTQSAESGTKGASLAKTAVSALVAASKSLFGGAEIPIPTDESPLKITEDVVLCTNHLSYKGSKIEYGDIESLSYSGSSSSVNLIPTGFYGHLRITCADDRTITVKMKDLFIKRKRSKTIQNAYIFLRHITFKQRLDPYVRKLETQGFIDCGDLRKTRLFANGDVEQDQNGGLPLRINLKQACKRKCVAFGTFGSDYVMGTVSSTFNPEEVLIGETNLKRGSRRIVLFLIENKDVIEAILRWFCTEGKD